MQAPFVARAEPGVDEDAELYSSDEAEYMETDAPVSVEAHADSRAAVHPAKVSSVDKVHVDSEAAVLLAKVSGADGQATKASWPTKRSKTSGR